jgi:TRAP-type C4-dicarboxylate transport system permease small subunit
MRHALQRRSGGDTGKATWLVRIDEFWTRWETAIAVTAVSLEVLSMSLWVMLKGLSTPADSESGGGVIFRVLLLALVLGGAARWGSRNVGASGQRWAVAAGISAGIWLGRRFAYVGVDYTSNLLNWYQQACVLTLLGGLRGVGTRLTLLLALVGGSLATARGRHVVLDIGTRLMRPRMRAIVVVAGWFVSAVVSAAAAWGFLDHIAIENFGATAEMTAKQKLDHVRSRLEEDAFITKTQLLLDFRAAPHVLLKGEAYADWMKGREWNAFLSSSGLMKRYGRDKVRPLEIAENESRAPLIVIPGRGEPRGELISAANLVFPIGLLVIALRFVLRALLVLSGQADTEPDEGEDAEPDRDAAGPAHAPLAREV